MEQLWKTMHSFIMEDTSDQRIKNFALINSKIAWKSKKVTFHQENSGTTPSGLKVVVLPPVYMYVPCTVYSER